MKQLTLIRHAKADSNHDLYDLDRPLNSVGEQNATKMGEFLSENLPKPNLIISSPAVRAMETAEIIASQTGYPIEKIQISDELYLCSSSEYIEVLNSQSPKTNHIFLISHNPGTTYFANLLTGENMADVPSCTAIHMNLDLYKWEDIEPNVGKLIGIHTPKNI